MAFSYSDENFTVIGNLCFVHIYIKDETPYYDIPPAIRDRMLYDNFLCIYLSNEIHGTQPAMSIAQFKSGKIVLGGNGYLFCYFPIDSNK